MGNIKEKTAINWILSHIGYEYFLRIPKVSEVDNRGPDLVIKKEETYYIETIGFADKIVTGNTSKRGNNRKQTFGKPFHKQYQG
jgi:hypothetical protein